MILQKFDIPICLKGSTKWKKFGPKNNIEKRKSYFYEHPKIYIQ